jgi:multidrug resistance efflux pump
MKARARLLVVAGALIATTAAVLARRLGPADASGLPTAIVRRGPVSLTVHTRGEIRASRTVPLVAPAAAGTLKIVSILSTGSRVKAGDVVCTFDPAEVQKRLEDALGGQLQTEQELASAEANIAIQEGSDELELLGYQMAVRRLELDAKRNELLSPVEAKSNEEALDDARLRLESVERDLALRKSGRTTGLVGTRERVRQAGQAVDEARQLLATLQLRATGDGLVVIPENTDAAGGLRVSGTALLPYRPGDVVTPGRTVAEIMDLRELEVLAHVPEGDAANLTAGAAARVTTDAGPQAIEATVKEIANLASLTPWGLRRLDVTFALGRSSVAVHPGETAAVTVAGPTLPDVRHVPRQAVMERDGRLVVYVRHGGRFEPRPVGIVRQTETDAVVDALAEGEVVALADPEAAGGRR